MQREFSKGFPLFVFDVLSQQYTMQNGNYLHIIDLAGLHVAPVFIRNIIFTLDLSFGTRSDLLIIQEGKNRARSSGLNINTLEPP